MILSGKMKVLGVALLLSVAVSACGSNEPAKPVAAAKPVPLDLSFMTVPAQPKVGQETDLRLWVKRGGKLIQDADSRFEIWKDGETDPSKHIMLTGMYGIDNHNYYDWRYTFTQPGKYHITLNTTVDNFHQMPTKDFTVTE